MTDFVRMIAIGGTVGVLTAGTLAAPHFIGAVAQEQTAAVTAAVEEIFRPAAIDPGIFARYDITFDESVSTDVQRTRMVTKIAHGRKSTVSIATTASGTYSSDALLSPYVRYPGIEVTRKPDEMEALPFDAYWSTRTVGSFTYITFRVPART